MVELFAVGQRLVIAQERVPNKACERSAVPELLKTINVQGAIISLDAHYTYIPDLQHILQAGADYIMGIKGNQGILEAEVHHYFAQAHAIGYQSDEFKCHTTLDKGHGRIETRHICVTQELDWLDTRKEWGFKSLIETRSERLIGDKVEKEVFYYGSSREGTPQQFGGWIRGHWEIESLHYVADVIFGEDASLANVGHAAENMALLRRLAMNIIKSFDPKRGMADARRNAAYEPTYLRGLLSRLFERKC
jgi:predicted transposase YbfD/YdcC